jgi:hypothetical protein
LPSRPLWVNFVSISIRIRPPSGNERNRQRFVSLFLIPPFGPEDAGQGRGRQKTGGFGGTYMLPPISIAFGPFLFVFGYRLERNERNGARLARTDQLQPRVRVEQLPLQVGLHENAKNWSGWWHRNMPPPPAFFFTPLVKNTFELDKQDRNGLTREFALKSTPKSQNWSGTVEETGL